MSALNPFDDTGNDYDDDNENVIIEEGEDSSLAPRVDRRKQLPEEAKKPKKDKKVDDKPRSRKAKFPTPMFNFFALAINTVALFVAGFSLFHETESFQSFSPLPFEHILLTVLGLLAVGVSMYASGAKQTAENRKTRSTLTALSLALGVVLILAVGFILLF